MRMVIKRNERSDVMRRRINYLILVLPFLLLMFGALQSQAVVFIQCPCPPGTPVSPETGNIECTVGVENIACKHLTAGDGFIKMADGQDMYIFGFHDVTGVPEDMTMEAGMLAAEFSAPTITVKEGQVLYLSLTNAGMVIRPDLFDPHTVHWHGFPNAAPVFDGEPFASISINMGATLTYYYNVVQPGTYMYHCHVEAPEHMQMGMLGNLYVTPAQDGTTINGFNQFAYNDGDGSTGYNVSYPIEIASFDPVFHTSDLEIQPLPFAAMNDTFPMLNGRGYPDTVNPSPIANKDGKLSQRLPTKIEATQGDRILLRISSLSTTSFHTLTVLGIPMKVVGKDAKLFRGPTGIDLYYDTNSITLGGGQSADLILDTTNVAPGTYFLYVTNMEHLNNDTEEYGGMMTEIVIN
jgi:FtsP/CotA-like multicopper oxidase with cupredoxin domain